MDSSIILTKWDGFVMDMDVVWTDWSFNTTLLNPIKWIPKCVHFIPQTCMFGLVWLADFDQNHEIIPNGPKLLRESVNILKQMSISSINLNKFDLMRFDPFPVFQPNYPVLEKNRIIRRSVWPKTGKQGLKTGNFLKNRIIRAVCAVIQQNTMQIGLFYKLR